MYAVMGATGQTGGAVLETLRGQGGAVRAICRDQGRGRALMAKGAEVAVCDANDSVRLAAAFADVEAAYLMLVPPPQAADVIGDSRQMAQAIAGAVRRARVPHVVALSSAGAHLARGTGIVQTLHDFEQALLGAAPSVTFLRAADFMENWAAVLPAASGSGVLPSARLPLHARGESVSALDVGHVAADLLSRPQPGTRVVNLVGPAQYSAVDAAAILSTLLARTVTAVSASRGDTIAALQASGAGRDYAEKLADLADAVNAGRMGFPPGSGDMLRGAVTLEGVLRRLLQGGP